MVLCFSTFSSILVKCKAQSTKQVALGRAMLNALHPNCEGDYSDSSISDLVHGKKNIPILDVDDAKNCNPKKLAEQFRKDVIPLLDSNKIGNIVLALKDVVSQDSIIERNTIVELVNNMTKQAFLEKDAFVFADLLAGLLLYIIRNTNNSGTKSDADSVTSEYVTSFDLQKDSIVFLDSYSNESSLISVSLMATAHEAVLLAESEGKCIRCGRPIAVGGDNEVKRATLVTLPDGTDIVTCADCACVVAAMNEAEQKALTEKQMAARELNRIRDDIAVEKLDGDIEAVLRSVDQLNEDDNTELRLDPLTIDKKVTEKRLREHIRTDVLSLYPGVNETLDRLAGEGRINPTRFARQIRRIFENAASPVLSERKIYDLIVDKLNTVSGGRYKTACEVIVSYFVQRCEVFNEIAE